MNGANGANGQGDQARQERATRWEPKWAPNGLRYVNVACPNCGRFVCRQAVILGYMERVCSQCKALLEFQFDRALEPKNVAAYAREREEHYQALQQMGEAATEVEKPAPWARSLTQ